MGPLFYYELVRRTRRGREPLIRCAYVLALLATLFILFRSYFPDATLWETGRAPTHTVSPLEMADLAQNLVLAVLIVQSLAVCVLAPACLAGAVRDDRERGTLELLLTTHLSDREIVLGKLAAGILRPLGVLVAGLPVIALAMLLGGIDPSALPAVLAASVLNALCVGSLCVLISALSGTSSEAMKWGYGYAPFFLAFAFVPILGPVGMFQQLTDGSLNQMAFMLMGISTVFNKPLPATIICLTFNCLVAALALAVSVRKLRPPLYREARPPWMPWYAYAPLRPSAARGRNRIPPAPGIRRTLRNARFVALLMLILFRAFLWCIPLTHSLRYFDLTFNCFVAGCALVLVVKILRPPRWEARLAAPPRPRPQDATGRRIAPPVGDRPLLWKELYQDKLKPVTPEAERQAWNKRYGPIAALVVLLGMLWYFAIAVAFSPGVSDDLAVMMRFLLAALAFALCTSTAVRAAGSVSLEHDRRTLDGLLMLPVDRTAVLGAKWLGPVLRGRLLGFCIVLVGVTGVLSGVFHPAGLPLVAVAVAVHACFWASAGLWLSVVCRTTLQARVGTALVVVLVFGGSWVFLSGHPQSHPERLVSDPASGVGMVVFPTAFAELGLNPARCWWFLMIARGGRVASDPSAVVESQLFGVRLAAAAAGTAAFALAAGLLWLDACRRFRKV